jgi:hypothetical protein
MINLAEDYPAVAAAIREAMAENFGTFDSYGIFEPKRDVREVPSEAYDGFMPFTNGGVDCKVMRMLDTDGQEARGREAEIIRPYLDSAEKDAAEAFIDDRGLRAEWEAYDGPEDVVTWLYKRWNDAEELHDRQSDALGRVPFWQTAAGAEREAFHEFESEYLSDGGEYWLVGRAHFYARDNHRNKLGTADEVYFYSGVNTDFTYGRDKGTEIVWQRSYPLARLTPKRARIIVKAMAEALT